MHGGRLHLRRQAVERARRAARCHLEHMGVDHRRADIRVAEQLLHSADVGAGLQQVGRKRMAQGMDGYRLGDARARHRLLECPLHPVFVQMVAAFDAGARIDRQRGRREQPEPGPGLAGTRVFDHGARAPHTSRVLRRQQRPSLPADVALATAATYNKAAQRIAFGDRWPLR
jgi:hypothetical protein